jgi:hypothetical protein
MKNPWAKAAAVIVGIFLLLFAVGMLMEGSGFTQTGRNSALAYIIALLGVGLVGAAFLGDTLSVSGDKLGPFGKIAATGGAAIFVVGLLFIYSTSESSGEAKPEPTPTQSTSPAPTQDPGEQPAGPQAIATNTSTPPAPVPVASQTYYAWTYCSACCPYGPDGCPQIGFGEGPSSQVASAQAIEECVFNNGIAQTCAANVQLYAGDDLPY